VDPRLAAYFERLPNASPTEPGAGAAGGKFAASFVRQLASAGLTTRFVMLAAAHVAEAGLVAAGWAFIGTAAVRGRMEGAALSAWTLSLLSIIPLRLLARWLEGLITVGGGGLLKERLLAGAMALDADAVHRHGVGELMGEVLETEAIERVAVGGGLDAVLAAIELGVAALAFAWAPTGGMQIALLAAWCAAIAAGLAVHVRRRRAWTDTRLAPTCQLVERMLAHRTRKAQQRPPAWHHEEAAELQEYLTISESLDRSIAFFEAALPHAYIVGALLAFAPALLSSGSSVGERAVALGAILFAADALQRCASGLTRGSAAWIAWRRVAPISDAAPTLHDDLQPDAVQFIREHEAGLRVHDVSFRYDGRVEPAVRAADLTIRRGDRLLLEGPAGSGKSTISALLGGFRRPSTGVILYGGLDVATAGRTAWRRRIAVVPQFHENHIFSATLAFNLLIGRPYPHTRRDVEDAQEICRELGLGSLVERMPAGLDQMVGETGWQLSHGERTRVFLARALLQPASVLVLDETLASLDPETLGQCLDCVLRRAPSLLAIAHP